MRIFIIFSFFISFNCFAQNFQSDDSRTPQMLISGSDLKQMQLTKLNVNVSISHIFAKTSMTMTFFNPNDRDLAGDLVFPLPEGALVSGYALDVNGEMVDGSIVKKEKARRVLDTEIRKGVDPGLIEFTKGNNYRTRVFPIPAKGVRIVRVDYINELGFNDSTLDYHLPFGFKDKLEQLDLNIEVLQTNSVPIIKSNGSLSHVNFKKMKNGYVATTQIKDVALAGLLTVEIPDEESDSVYVEQGIDGQYYFSVVHKPQSIKQSSAVIAPKNISVIWDASGSRDAVDHKRELVVLSSYLKQLADKRSKPIKVSVNLLRNSLSKTKSFSIAKGNSDDLINHLENINYDGGTQLGEIRNKTRLPKKVDQYLIFTDGLSNFGKTFTGNLKSPAVIISNDIRSDHNLLRHIAESSGGQYFNLNKLNDNDVSNAIGKTQYSFQKSSHKSNEVSEFLPVSAKATGERFVFSGKLNNDQALLTLNFKTADNRIESKVYQLAKEDALNGSLMRTIWAQSKVNNLLVYDKDNTQALFELGQTYGLVTPETSLLVLETLDQYVEHEIIPPDSLPAMQTEYDELIAEIKLDEKKNIQDRINDVLELWEGRIEWWETDFSKQVISKEPEGEVEEIIVSGYRQSVSRPEDSRRIETQIVDGLTADEIGDIPALSIGEALETITGASSFSDPHPDSTSVFSKIQIKAWQADTPYLKKLQSVEQSKILNTYYSLRKDYHNSVSFFLDCADFFYQQNKPEFALQILSNIVELDLDNPALNRIVGHRLRQAEEFGLSKLMFEEVIRLRPEEPQSYRDLAFVLAEQGEYDQAIELLYSIIIKYWDRFEGIELVVLNELNSVIAKAKEVDVKNLNIDPRFLKLLDLDIRIVMTWDADLTDIDLHVIEPNKEEAYFENSLTNKGGLVSRDFTQGYGPEEYLIRKAEKGKYKVRAKYYSNNSPSVIGPVTVQLDIYTNYGRENEKHQSTTVQLKTGKEIQEVGEIEF